MESGETAVFGGPEGHRRRFDLVVMAASIGGIRALECILGALPPDYPLPIAIVQHRTQKLPNLLPVILGRHTALRVKLAETGEPLCPGVVYIAAADSHLTVMPDHTFALSNGSRIRHVRSSANPLFESAAKSLNGRVIAVVLTGGDRDATDGVQAVKAAGGIVLAQDQATSGCFSMPRSAIETGCVDRVLPLQEIAPTLISLSRS